MGFGTAVEAAPGLSSEASVAQLWAALARPVEFVTAGVWGLSGHQWASFGPQRTIELAVVGH